MSLDPKTARVAVITGASSGVGEASVRQRAPHWNQRMPIPAKTTE
jgi:NADP-dependent 3-hydroxy acid dehydrogenase YdfG